jgi:hypothetical protein
MKTGILIKTRDNHSFHTIILKRQIINFTYFTALGYAGGGEFEEFFAKLKNVNGQISGIFSRSNGSGEWEEKFTRLEFNQDEEWFDSEIEDLYEFFDSEEEIIQKELMEEIRKYILFGYDDETGEDFEYPEIKDIDMTVFNEFEDNVSSYHNKDWDNSFLEITNSNIWSLSIRFPDVIKVYKESL